MIPLCPSLCFKLFWPNFISVRDFSLLTAKVIDFKVA